MAKMDVKMTTIPFTKKQSHILVTVVNGNATVNNVIIHLDTHKSSGTP